MTAGGNGHPPQSNGVSNGNRPAAAAGPTPDLVAAKAAQHAALQAKIQARLANSAILLNQTAAATGTGAAAGGSATPAAGQQPWAERRTRDFTLLLDDQGRQVDAEGRVVKLGPVQTLKVNRHKGENPYLAHGASGGSDDPSLRHRQARTQKALQFVEPGRYSKLGDTMRFREQRQFLRGRAEGRANNAEQLDEPATASAASASAAGAEGTAAGVTS
ncbi:unnamed protein product, partial [Phaeothamnion confervicola]